MRNGRAKGALGRTHGIHMDPLVVACGLGKAIDLRLCDGQPFAPADILAHACGQLIPA